MYTFVIMIDRLMRMDLDLSHQIWFDARYLASLSKQYCVSWIA